MVVSEVSRESKRIHETTFALIFLLDKCNAWNFVPYPLSQHEMVTVLEGLHQFFQHSQGDRKEVRQEVFLQLLLNHFLIQENEHNERIQNGWWGIFMCTCCLNENVRVELKLKVTNHVQNPRLLHSRRSVRTCCASPSILHRTCRRMYARIPFFRKDLKPIFLVPEFFSLC